MQQVIWIPDLFHQKGLDPDYTAPVGGMSRPVQNKVILNTSMNDRVQNTGNRSFLQVRASGSSGLGPWSKRIILGRLHKSAS